MEEKEFEEMQHDIPEVKMPRNFLGNIASFFIDKYKVTFFLVAIVIIWGVGAFSRMPRELSPEIILPYGIVTAVYTGAAPDEIESLVTDIIEPKLMELDNVKSIRSTSAFGYSSVVVEFETGTDIDDAIQEMREKVSAANLPDDVETPSVMSLKTNESPIITINIGGDYNPVELKKIADNIKTEIEKINNVSDVTIIGGIEREIKINVNPEMLKVYGITLDTIRSAIAASNINFPGGNLELDNKNYNIRTISKIEEIDEFQKIVIKYIGNNPLFLKDIAVIEDGYADIKSYSRLYQNAEGSEKSISNTIAISVKKKESADIIKTSASVKKAIEQMRGKTYPENLQVFTTGDMAKYVDDELMKVIGNASSGLILVIIVLFIFIGLKESLVVAVVIPLTILITFGLMKYNNMTLNTITLFSLILAVGMIVDNGIVIMENIDRLRGLGVNNKIAAKAATNQIAPAVMASTLTTLGAFFPLILTTGIMGEFIKGIPLTVIYALSASFFVAITVTPSLCAMVLKNDENRKKKSKFRETIINIISIVFVVLLSMLAFEDGKQDGINLTLLSFVSAAFFGMLMYYKLFATKNVEVEKSPIIRKYAEFLEWIIISTKRKVMVIIIVICSLVASLSLLVTGVLKVEMFSSTDNTALYINFEAEKGTKIDRTKSIVEEAEKELFKIPEIKAFVSNIGITGADTSGGFGLSSMGDTPNIARISVDLVEKEERNRTSMDIAEELREKIKKIPGAKISISEESSGPPSGSAVTIKLLSENMDILKEYSSVVEKIVKQDKNTLNVENSLVEGAPEVQIKINKERASAFGLSTVGIAMDIRNTINGVKSTTFKNNQEEIDVVIRTTNSNLKTIDDLNNIYFYSYMGTPIPASQVIELEVGKSYSGISHEDTKRIAQISADLKTNANAVEVTNAIKTEIDKNKLPNNLEVKYGGETEEITESFTNMMSNMGIAVIIIFTILVIQFNSISQPLLILATLPLALIGVMPGLVITGNNFGFVAFVGVVALAGIVVNNAIILIDYINYLRNSGYELNDAIIKTGMTRFIPVMATTITTVGGIIPMSLQDEMFGSLGYTIIFGLSVSTILTLIVIPIMYSLLEGRRIKKAKKRAIKRGELLEN